MCDGTRQCCLNASSFHAKLDNNVSMDPNYCFSGARMPIKVKICFTLSFSHPIMLP